MARNMAVTDSMRIMLAKLPVLLNRLGNIPDPRNPKKIMHKLTLIAIYGILTLTIILLLSMVRRNLPGIGCGARNVWSVR